MWIGFAAGLELASLDLGLGQAQLTVSGCGGSGLVRVGVGLA